MHEVCHFSTPKKDCNCKIASEKRLWRGWSAMGWANHLNPLWCEYFFRHKDGIRRVKQHQLNSPHAFVPFKKSGLSSAACAFCFSEIFCDFLPSFSGCFCPGWRTSQGRSEGRICLMKFPDLQVFYTQFKAAAASYRHGHTQKTARKWYRDMDNMQRHGSFAFAFCKQGVVSLFQKGRCCLIGWFFEDSIHALLCWNSDAMWFLLIPSTRYTTTFFVPGSIDFYSCMATIENGINI